MPVVDMITTWWCAVPIQWQSQVCCQVCYQHCSPDPVGLDCQAVISLDLTIMKYKTTILLVIVHNMSS